ncbi:MAG: hypothetical protein K8R21_06240 [Leptospira sp.]|nr:hypothetical protein [Leptospira sp.]
MDYCVRVGKDTKLDDYEKILATTGARKVFFGENLATKIYPSRDSELVEKFFSYSEHYLRKHRNDSVRSIKIHLEKAREEIYGSEYDRIKNSEPYEKVIALELQIYEKEISILTDSEKDGFVRELKRKLR